MDQVNNICIGNDIIDGFNDHPGKFSDTPGYLEPEELARIILEETPEAVEPFNSLEEMVEYIREAMAANYIFGSKSDKL